MLNGLVSSGSVNFLLVFLEGLVSFFSPCVIPLLPIYMSYLAGNTNEKDEEGNIIYKRGKVFYHTVFFVLGVSISFFLLGISFSALGTFFSSNKTLFSRIGGIIITFLGLFQLGIFDFKFLRREHKMEMKMNVDKMNPLVALVMGFTFSFAWTPCVGPALSSVMIMASSAKSALTGNLLVFVYAMGFVIPFLILGLFTSQALNFLRKKRNLLKYTIKFGGVLLVIIGIMTFTGLMNGVTGYLSSFGGASSAPTQYETPKADENPGASTDNNNGDTPTTDTPTASGDVVPAPDFELSDQYGNVHKLSDYKDKVVFLNFWATWCPPCRGEMPHIEELYNELGLNKDDVVILGVAEPKTDKNPNAQDDTIEDISKFLTDNKYTFPVVFDTTGEVVAKYQVSALPTTFMIGKDGSVFGYVPGAMNKDTMKNIIDQTLDA